MLEHRIDRHHDLVSFQEHKNQDKVGGCHDEKQKEDACHHVHVHDIDNLLEACN